MPVKDSSAWEIKCLLFNSTSPRLATYLHFSPPKGHSDSTTTRLDVPIMSVAHHDHPMDVKPSLVPQYDDAMSDISMASSVHGPDSFNGRFSPTTESDRQSINSYASTIDREFILKDVHGRIVNSTNEVGVAVCSV